ncbi:hypothetical protein KSF_103620 [Reticulibacter mediterranei]|uniref:SnoaL-like domain-containing protein n=1 Tax=Reticulibacter mediterranei TaxID=2778369 RepID=A0A8J3N6L3_9CHLR|nr:nuclear transport factor 2 family protein [Reticulibacter mediterranei]GHP00315.1 hypothetical protein KSF_103620 [Reticulibacter mediterranei]
MNQEPSEATLRLLLDRACIADVVTRFITSVDLGKWQDLRACFTEEIDLDYTSLHGGEPEHLPIDQVIARWRKVSTSHAFRHLLTNQEIVLQRDEATYTAYMQAHHFLPESGEVTWTLGGRYTITLARNEQGWKIRSVTFFAEWVTGNQEVIARSQKRFAQPQQQESDE